MALALHEMMHLLVKIGMTTFHNFQISQVPN